MKLSYPQAALGWGRRAGDEQQWNGVGGKGGERKGGKKQIFFIKFAGLDIKYQISKFITSR